MNHIATILYDTADALAAGTDPGAATAQMRVELGRLRTRPDIDLDLLEAVRWLDASGKICAALGLSEKAAELDHAAATLADGGLVPSGYYFAALDLLPARTKATAAAPSGPIEVAPVTIAKMPVRVTTRRIKRDASGYIIEVIDISEDG